MVIEELLRDRAPMTERNGLQYVALLMVTLLEPTAQM